MADATRRVSVRLSLDDAARVKQELREVGETGQRSLERIQGGADRASRALDLLDVAVRGVQIAGLAAGLRAVVVAGDALARREAERYERLRRRRRAVLPPVSDIPPDRIMAACTTQVAQCLVHPDLRQALSGLIAAEISVDLHLIQTIL